MSNWLSQYDDDSDDNNEIDINNNNNKDITIEKVGDHRIIRDNVTGSITIDLHSTNNNIESNNNNKRKNEENENNDINDDDETTQLTLQQKQNQPKIGVDKCIVCNDKISKYKCPGCFILFCSLDCMNRHKSSTNCTGVKRVTQFIPLNQMTDRDVVNDFTFLDNINRISESGKSIIDQSMVQYKSIYLQKAAFKRSINLYIMPKQMTRHKENTTSLRQKTNQIYWRIEWIFVQDGFKIINDSVSEKDTLRTILFNHIDHSTNRYNLKKYHKHNQSGTDPILLMKRERSSINQYYKINLDDNLEHNLQFKEVIEFPTLLIFNQNELSEASSNYQIIENQQLEVIKQEQLNLISQFSKSKFDPNLVNTHDQINQLAKVNSLRRKKKKQKSSSSSTQQSTQQSTSTTTSTTTNSTTTSKTTTTSLEEVNKDKQQHDTNLVNNETKDKQVEDGDNDDKDCDDDNDESEFFFTF